jgi:hypothetical protein
MNTSDPAVPQSRSAHDNEPMTGSSGSSQATDAAITFEPDHGQGSTEPPAPTSDDDEYEPV